MMSKTCTRYTRTCTHTDLHNQNQTHATAHSCTCKPAHTHHSPGAQSMVDPQLKVVCDAYSTGDYSKGYLQLFVAFSACSGGDDTNERDVFDRLFEAAPEKLGAVKTVNYIHAHTDTCTYRHMHIRTHAHTDTCTYGHMHMYILYKHSSIVTFTCVHSMVHTPPTAD